MNTRTGHLPETARPSWQRQNLILTYELTPVNVAMALQSTNNIYIKRYLPPNRSSQASHCPQRRPLLLPANIRDN